MWFVLKGVNGPQSKPVGIMKGHVICMNKTAGLIKKSQSDTLNDNILKLCFYLLPF